MRRVGIAIVATIVAGCGGPEFSDALFGADLRGPDASVGEDAGAPVDVGSVPVDAAPYVDAETTSEQDASSVPACDAAYPATDPIPCEHSSVVAPSQYGYDHRLDAGGNSCAPRPMPPECQCAGTYTCECLLASEAAPTCPGDASASCLVSYPELGGIVVFGCGL